MTVAKGIVLHQPYATLVAEGAKTIETRCWPAPATVRDQRIAIIAGKSTDSLEVLDLPAFDRALAGVVEGGLEGLRTRLPLGVVVATARLAGVEQMDWDFLGRWPESNPQAARERAFGWFGFARYAWHLADVRRLDTPIPVRGMQRVFNLPGDVAAAINAQEVPDGS